MGSFVVGKAVVVVGSSMYPLELQIKSGLSLQLQEGGTIVNLDSIVTPSEDVGYNNWENLKYILEVNNVQNSLLDKHASDIQDPFDIIDVDEHETNSAFMLFKLLSPTQKLSGDALNKELSTKSDLVLLWASDTEFWGADVMGKAIKLHIHVFLALCVEKGIKVTIEDTYLDRLSNTIAELVKIRDTYMAAYKKINAKLVGTLSTEEKKILYKELNLHFQSMELI